MVEPNRTEHGRSELRRHAGDRGGVRRHHARRYGWSVHTDDATRWTPGRTSSPVEIRTPGYQTMSFDVDIVAGEVTPFQGTMERD